MESKSELESVQLSAQNVRAPAKLPREAKICCINEMEPGEVAYTGVQAIIVDRSDSIWINACHPIWREKTPFYNIRVRRLETGVEIMVPKEFLFARSFLVDAPEILPVFKFDYVEDEMMPLDI